MRWWFKSADEKRQEMKDEIIAQLKATEQEAEDEKNKDGWVHIKGAVIDEEHGMKMELDWNDQFIDYLRENGINGADDEVVVQKWITMLYADLMDHNVQEGGGDDLI